jgi:hypothetical protein
MWIFVQRAMNFFQRIGSPAAAALQNACLGSLFAFFVWMLLHKAPPLLWRRLPVRQKSFNL